MANWLIKEKNKTIDKFIVLDNQKLILGRSPNVDITINNITVSRRHASFERQGDTVTLTDLGSRNGTMVNGKVITGSVQINASDVIKIGKFTLVPPRSKDEGSQFVAIRMKEDRFTRAGATQRMDETFYLGAQAEKKAIRRLSQIKGAIHPKDLVLNGKLEYFIGKSQLNDIQLKGLFVNKNRCSIRNQNNSWYLKPQSDSEPPSLNDKKVSELTELHPGDIIGINSVKIKFE
ncbi:MAG: FHA domain-containing protein [Proteobacteria bacterium]|nr:FHA domain-containing protein [Pseudomonadota bacterium]MBU1687792.1 FHA domain-containing protein [Pseudomonadota bacterium]